jgi:AbrB family looped-hinge helix DNA binding protein
MKARILSKGQLVLPQKIREARGFTPGSEVEIEEVPGGVLLKLVRSCEEASLEDLLGCTGYRGPRRTLEDMEAAIRERARARR